MYWFVAGCEQAWEIIHSCLIEMPLHKCLSSNCVNRHVFSTDNCQEVCFLHPVPRSLFLFVLIYGEFAFCFLFVFFFCVPVSLWLVFSSFWFLFHLVFLLVCFFAHCWCCFVFVCVAEFKGPLCIWYWFSLFSFFWTLEGWTIGKKVCLIIQEHSLG